MISRRCPKCHHRHNRFDPCVWRPSPTAIGIAIVVLLALAIAVSAFASALDASQQARDLNRATVASLDSVPRVGPKLAAALVARRDSINGYRAWAQVDSVRGVGPKLLAALQARFFIPSTGASK